jgi:hypothetical protein
MKQEKETETRRQAYKKPVLRTIDLAAEEVLDTGCKTGGSATNSATCGVNSCSTIGTS